MATGVILKDMQNAIKRKAEIDDASLNYLAEQAVSIGLGVRWMKSQIMNVIDDLILHYIICASPCFFRRSSI